MRTEPLSLAHKDLLFERLRLLGTAVSEYSFSNLYLYRQVHRYEVLLGKDIFISGTTYDGRRYLMPTTDPRRMDITYLTSLMRDFDFLFPVPEVWLSPFDPRRFSISFHEADADYVYTVEKMRTFAGRRLHRKRNLLKQFTSSHAHEALPLSSDRLPDARFVLEEWLRGSGQRPEDTDYWPCSEALSLYDQLVLCGGIFYADGEPAGFAIGEEQNPETFVLHFAKGRTIFKGVYQYIFNRFASVLPEMYRYINIEQDLDREALRISKSSYIPDLMLRKARVALRDNNPPE